MELRRIWSRADYEALLEKMAEHDAKWDELPQFPTGEVFSDDDAEAFGDLVYLRGLVNDLQDIYRRLLKRISDPAPISADDLFAVRYLESNAEWGTPYLESFTFGEPWPTPEQIAELLGADLIAEWKSQREAAS